ncbi:MAG: efflux RND transporter periplasmic adaptor subunit [Pseudomonadota bacterium]|nr:efflux RND transporter periplasmic adaptor subunit [Pseudomonadota bacterium]MDP1902892.1 efflux RND transporter periplasmic adaptor subunit [Pseudomonadota bacterium]MDP2350948.1 efflux RND transporter periplasmic adaptor subunit [Pseudomonadota bacterium]
MQRHSPVAWLLPALMLASLAACKPQSAAPPGGMAGMPPAEVGVVSVTPRQVPITLEAPGRLQAVRTAEVRARVEGILERRTYREGSEVKAGAVLFRIDDRSLAANLASVRANLDKARAQALIAAQNLERMRSLAGSKAISKQELDQAVASGAQADAEVAAAKAAVTRAEIDLSHATVIAPISGRIGRALVSEGALVGKGEATPLASIEQYDPIWVNFSQSSAEFLNLREAQGKPAAAPVNLVLENGRVYPLPGKLLFSDLAVDPATGSVGLRAEFPNPDRSLLPGQFVTVRLPVAQAENAIVVPQRALQVTPQGQAVLLVGGDGKVESRPVKTAGLTGGDWIISEGLSGGEQVIVDGVQKARPGSQVNAVAAKP